MNDKSKKDVAEEVDASNDQAAKDAAEAKKTEESAEGDIQEVEGAHTPGTPVTHIDRTNNTDAPGNTTIHNG